MTTQPTAPARIDYRLKAHRQPRREMTDADYRALAQAYAGQLSRLVQLVALDMMDAQAKQKAQETK